MTSQGNSKTKINKSCDAKFLHTGIKENEEADKAAKQAIDMPFVQTTT